MTLLLKKFWWIGAILLLVSALYQVNKMRLEEKAEKERVSANFENYSKETDRKFDLTNEEYKQFKDQSKTKIDSVREENSLLRKKLRSAMVINTTYKDTSKTGVSYGQPQQVNAPNQANLPQETISELIPKYFKIPVEKTGNCWGMKGVIYSKDPDSKLEITERTANNSIQRLEISNRFWGFLWITKKSKYVAFTDCGELNITDITFKK